MSNRSVCTLVVVCFVLLSVMLSPPAVAAEGHGPEPPTAVGGSHEVDKRIAALPAGLLAATFVLLSLDGRKRADRGVGPFVRRRRGRPPQI